MKVKLLFIDDEIFEGNILDNRFKNSGSVCNSEGRWPKIDITIRVRESIKNDLVNLIPLLIHEHIHAINSILFGWCFNIQKCFDYLNEVIWVIFRDEVNAIFRILHDEKNYYNMYWRR